MGNNSSSSCTGLECVLCCELFKMIQERVKTAMMRGGGGEADYIFYTFKS